MTDKSHTDAAAQARTQPRLSGIDVDWWAESVKLYRQNQKLRKALKEQHDWHLAQGEQDFGDGIKLNMADEYADSSMYERTVAALDDAQASSVSSTHQPCANFPGCHCKDSCIDGWSHPSPVRVCQVCGATADLKCGPSRFGEETWACADCWEPKESESGK